MKHSVKLSTFIDGEEYTSGIYVDPDLTESGDAFNAQDFLKQFKMMVWAMFRKIPQIINEKEGREVFSWQDIAFALNGKPFKLAVTEEGEKWFKEQQIKEESI